MPRDGKTTRDRILAETKTLVLDKGFVGSSIDQILEKTGITKGAFFYHFKSKNDLAKALIEEYAREDLSHLEDALNDTEHLDGDPLNRLLQFTQLFIDMMTGLSQPHAGCLYASFTNESSQFSHEIKDIISKSILSWRNALEELIQKVIEEKTPRIEVDVASLADLFTVIFEGGFVLSKALKEKDLTAKQLQHLKNYFQLIFGE